MKMINLPLYQLKRKYGKEIWLHRKLAVTADLFTGQKTVQYSKVIIKKVPVMPERDVRFLTDSGKIKFGNIHDSEDTVFLIDKFDLPVNYQFDLNQWIIVNNTKYIVTSFISNDFFRCYFVTGKELLGEDKNILYEYYLDSNLLLSDSVDLEYNNQYMLNLNDNLVFNDT